MNLYDKCYNHSKDITVQIHQDNPEKSEICYNNTIISTSTFHLNLFNKDSINTHKTIFLSPIQKHLPNSAKNNHMVPLIHYQLFDLASGTLEYVCILDKPILVDKYYFYDLLVGREYMDKPEFTSKLTYHFITTIIETLKDTIPLIIEQSIQWTLQY
jgi:hypothetical protein